MPCDQSTDTNLWVCCFPSWHQRESIDFPSCIIHKNANQLKPKITTPKLFFYIKYARIPRRKKLNHNYITISRRVKLWFSLYSYSSTLFLIFLCANIEILSLVCSTPSGRRILLGNLTALGINWSIFNEPNWARGRRISSLCLEGWERITDELVVWWKHLDVCVPHRTTTIRVVT